MLRLSTIALLGASLLGLSGCAQLLGIDPVSEAADASIADASIADATTPDAVPPDAAFACTESELALGTTNFDTDTATHDLSLSCGSGGQENDRQFLWRAPVTDYFVFDTVGSSFDTLLAFFDDCGGTELACSNNIEAQTASELVRRFESGDEVVVAVDGFAGDQGPGVVNIARVECPDSDLEGQTFPLTLTTLGAADDFSNACGGDGQEDRAYHWTAPEAGLYTFSALGAGDFLPIVSVVDGPRCADEELGCNRAAATDTHATVVRRLAAEQVISIYVDGLNGAGVYDLDVTKSDEVCPSETLPMNGALWGGSYTTRSMAPSCGFSEGRNGVNIIDEYGDATIVLDIPSVGDGCFGTCSLDIRSAGPFTVSVLENDDCSGPELNCWSATGIPAALFLPFDRVRLQNVQRTLIISTQDHSVGSFTILVDCNEACA